MATDFPESPRQLLPVPPNREPIPALKVHQWMPEWNRIAWNDDEHRSRPSKWFYQFSMSAADLKSLSGIYRRTVTDRDHAKYDLGIQRRYERSRSATIKKFVTSGYPWSDLSNRERKSGRFNDLRQPGWLPTAIIVNLLVEGSRRNNRQILTADLVKIVDRPDSNSTALVHLPDDFGDDWRYKSIPPIEVIDGQHRLWAFTRTPSSGFEVPVVAFVDLDLSWQAYLFYTINIKPKKINRSLAFDLYPLLRDEKWLTRFEGPRIYRETRAQEIVDLLWSTRRSPWFRRINMLGEPGYRELQVTQAAWIRSLLASFVKKWEGQRVQIGGLFGTKLYDKPALSWDLHTQAAFLILIGLELQTAIKHLQDKWADDLRRTLASMHSSDKDPAFFGRHNLLNQDQGVRILLQVANDIFFLKSNDIFFVESDEMPFILPDTEYGQNPDDWDTTRVQNCIDMLQITSIGEAVRDLGQALATYDWRAASAPGLTDDEKFVKQGFRGSGGYRHMREDVLRHLRTGQGWVAVAAAEVCSRLGYD